MTLKEFLSKETPENGCMLVETHHPVNKFFVVERKRIGKERNDSDEIILVNGRFYYDYEFVWEEYPNWKILYKHNS